MSGYPEALYRNIESMIYGTAWSDRDVASWDRMVIVAEVFNDRSWGDSRPAFELVYTIVGDIIENAAANVLLEGARNE